MLKLILLPLLLSILLILFINGCTSSSNIKYLQVRTTIPIGWHLSRTDNGPFFTHAQWSNPTNIIGVGVVKIYSPFQLQKTTIVNLLINQISYYGGNLTFQCTDGDKECFIVESEKYLSFGYIYIRDKDIWIIYGGKRKNRDINAYLYGQMSDMLKDILILE